MNLPEEAIMEFRNLYRETFGEELTDEQVKEKGQSLLDLFSLIYKPITKKKGMRNEDRQSKIIG